MIASRRGSAGSNDRGGEENRRTKEWRGDRSHIESFCAGSADLGQLIMARGHGASSHCIAFKGGPREAALCQEWNSLTSNTFWIRSVGRDGGKGAGEIL